MDFKSHLQTLKQHLEQQFETETPARRDAREKALAKLNAAIEEFETLSQGVATTPEQVSIISQLQRVIFQLGDLKLEK